MLGQVTPFELLKLIKTLAGNALMRGAARVGASGGGASAAAAAQPASALDAFEVYGAEEDRKLEGASGKGGDKSDLGPLALMEPAPEQLARLGAGPGGRIRRFLLLNQRPQKNVVYNCYWTIMGSCLGAVLPRIRNSEPETRNPKPKTPDPKHETKNPRPKTPDPKHETQNPKPEPRDPKPETQNTTHDFCNPKPDSRPPKPETRSPKPET